MTARFFDMLAVGMAIGVVMGATAARGADQADGAGASVLPHGGADVLGPEPLLALRFNGGAEQGAARMEVLEEGPFRRVLRVESKAEGRDPFEYQLTALTLAAVGKGDVLHVSFAFRTVSAANERGEARTEFVLEKHGPPHTKSVELPVGGGGEWKRYEQPFAAAADYGAGEALVCFRAAYGPQVFEIADLRILNFGKGAKLGDLPRSRVEYAGMEADAAWRAAAAARIEKHRKGLLRVRVADAAGKPLAGARVELAQKRHAFGFGSAVGAKALVGDGPDAEKYRDWVAKACSIAVFENDLKWPGWEKGAEERGQVFQALDWLEAKGIRVRGHTLVWPGWRWLPARLREKEGDAAFLRSAAEAHIRDIVGATKGRLVAWDVVNEPFANHDLTDILGKDEIARWFKLAREIDPKPALFLNDYASLVAGGRMTAHKRHFEETAAWLKASGAPVGGIGLQCHFGGEPTPPERLLEELDRLAKLGLDIHVTEFDMATEDESFQGQYTRDFLTAVFSHPSVSAILIWGFWEGKHWIPKAAMFRKDWSVKPNGEAWMRLTLEQWWTRTAGETDASGVMEARGFLGDYDVRVEAGGRKAERECALEAGGSEVEMRVE